MLPSAQAVSISCAQPRSSTSHSSWLAPSSEQSVGASGLHRSRHVLPVDSSPPTVESLVESLVEEVESALEVDVVLAGGPDVEEPAVVEVDPSETSEVVASVEPAVGDDVGLVEASAPGSVSPVPAEGSKQPGAPILSASVRRSQLWRGSRFTQT